MVVANQDSHSLQVYAVDKETGALTHRSSFDVRSPVWVAFGEGEEGGNAGEGGEPGAKRARVGE